MVKRRLINAPPRVAPGKPRVMVASGPDRDKVRRATMPWRKLYNTPRWRALRLQVFARDGYVCQQTGEVLVGKHPAPNSPVADHIVQHHGDEDLFFDIDNIQTVSKAYHDSEKQRLERKGGGGQSL